MLCSPIIDFFSGDSTCLNIKFPFLLVNSKPSKMSQKLFQILVVTLIKKA